MTSLMASLRLGLIFSVFVQVLLIFSSTVTCDDDDKLLQRINSYRVSLKLPPLAKNDNANCLADEIADQLEDEPCPTAINVTSPESQFTTYPKPLDKCHLSINNTREGAILLSCTRGHISSLAAFNFTDPLHTQHLNNSKYIGAGIGTEHDWVVVVLSTNTPPGNFVASGADDLDAKLHLSGYLLALLWSSFWVLRGAMVFA